MLLLRDLLRCPQACHRAGSELEATRLQSEAECWLRTADVDVVTTAVSPATWGRARWLCQKPLWSTVAQVC